MSSLVDDFNSIGRDTRQIGRFFCIPAVVSNAMRILGGDELSFSQERIRDVWYESKGKTPEQDINEQLRDAGPSVIASLKKVPDFCDHFESESFARPGSSAFDTVRANEALSFIEGHTAQKHPVLVSTDTIKWDLGILHRECCHMWLILDVDRKNNVATAHDPGYDAVFRIPIQSSLPLKMPSGTLDVEIGLLRRITLSNYFCEAFWKKGA